MYKKATKMRWRVFAQHGGFRKEHSPAPFSSNNSAKLLNQSGAGQKKDLVERDFVSLWSNISKKII